MGWRPFKKKRVARFSEPHLRGSRVWIQDLREVCERHYDSRASGQELVIEIQNEWKNAHSQGEVDESLLDGLERRANRLLVANDEEWMECLDDEEFWKPGWGSKSDLGD